MLRDKAAHVIAQEFGGIKVLPGSGTVKGLLQGVIDAECVVALVHGVFLFPVMYGYFMLSRLPGQCVIASPSPASGGRDWALRRFAQQFDGFDVAHHKRRGEASIALLFIAHRPSGISAGQVF